MSERPSSTPHPPPVLRARATGWLLFATALWGASFPLSKALYLAQARLLPGTDNFFLVAVSLVVRFGLAAVLMAAISRRTLPALTRLEISQGLVLGLFSAGGMLLQMDGINYTAASTSAFLTSCYCVVIPVIVAARSRRWPPARVAAGCALVVVGMAILAGVTPRALRLGRGEWETLGASVFFAGQILWLERPLYARNRTSHVTLVMFATLAAAVLPLMFAGGHTLREMAVAAAGSGPVAGLMLALMLGCTLVTCTLMNHWQRHLEATVAGLIYCAEPLWASLFALFLPGWLAVFAGVVYADEVPTWRLCVGGVLITAANVIVQFRL